jgi:hypothetical protein
MSKLNAKFILDLDEAVATLFAPAIAEGQSITCYIGEQMTPYIIQGENLPTPVVETSSADSLTAVQETHSLNAADIVAKGFSLAHDIAPGQTGNVSLTLNGLPLASGSDFTISGNSVSWAGLSLALFGLQPGDIFSTSYYMA